MCQFRNEETKVKKTACDKLTDTGQANGTVGRVNMLSLKKLFVCVCESLKFGLIMHYYCEKHNARRGGSWCILREHGRSQHNILLDTSAGPGSIFGI